MIVTMNESLKPPIAASMDVEVLCSPLEEERRGKKRQFSSLLSQNEFGREEGTEEDATNVSSTISALSEKMKTASESTRPTKKNRGSVLSGEQNEEGGKDDSVSLDPHETKCPAAPGEGKKKKSLLRRATVSCQPAQEFFPEENVFKADEARKGARSAEFIFRWLPESASSRSDPRHVDAHIDRNEEDKLEDVSKRNNAAVERKKRSRRRRASYPGGARASGTRTSRNSVADAPTMMITTTPAVEVRSSSTAAGSGTLSLNKMAAEERGHRGCRGGRKQDSYEVTKILAALKLSQERKVQKFLKEDQWPTATANVAWQRRIQNSAVGGEKFSSGERSRKCQYNQPMLLCPYNLELMVIETYRICNSVSSFYLSGVLGPKVTPQSRNTLTQWMVYVQRKLPRRPLSSFSLHLGVCLLDRFLSIVAVNRCANNGRDVGKDVGCNLDAIAAACMLIASKVQEIEPADPTDLSGMTEASFTVNEVISWETVIFHRLSYEVNGPTAFDFLQEMLLRIGAEGQDRLPPSTVTLSSSVFSSSPRTRPASAPATSVGSPIARAERIVEKEEEAAVPSLREDVELLSVDEAANQEFAREVQGWNPVYVEAAGRTAYAACAHYVLEVCLMHHKSLALPYHLFAAGSILFVICTIDQKPLQLRHLPTPIRRMLLPEEDFQLRNCLSTVAQIMKEFVYPSFSSHESALKDFALDVSAKHKDSTLFLRRMMSEEK